MSVKGRTNPPQQAASAYRRFTSAASGAVLVSKIFRAQACVFGDLCEHAGAYFVAIVKGKYEV